MSARLETTFDYGLISLMSMSMSDENALREGAGLQADSG